MNVGFILIAAGYGSLRLTESGHPVPKVLEHVAEIPMFLHPLIAAKDAGLEESIIVANPLFFGAMRTAVESAVDAGLIPRVPEFVVQSDRHGAARAAQCAIPAAFDRGISHGLLCYGDMPLWSATTMCSLLESREAADIVTMVTTERTSLYPALDRYGRVIRRDGSIARIVEPDQASPEELAVSSVNPSLWVWRLDWLAEHISAVTPVVRPDGRSAEIYLPPLIEIAHAQGKCIGEVVLPRDRIHEALGVNSREELSQIRSLTERQCIA